MRYRLRAGEPLSFRSIALGTYARGVPGAVPSPFRVPGLVLSGTVQVRSVDAAGRARVSVVARPSVGDPRGAPESIVRDLRAEMAAIGELRPELTFDARGRCLNFAMELPADLPAAAARTALTLRGQIPVMLTAHLPEEPVGVGARWERLRTVRRPEFLAHERVEIELVERDGDTFILSLRAEMAEPSRDVARGERHVRVLSAQRSLTGHGVGRLDTLRAETKGSGTKKTRQHRLPEGPEEEAMTHIETHMIIKPFAKGSVAPPAVSPGAPNQGPGGRAPEVP